ncbi:MAG: 3-dehydroquinate synthase II [Methanomicrobiales archaeon]|nr:3-dehydroquinate synthase II [Methanomicrobiales archaeon]
MKEFWVDIRPWRKEAATAALESGATALMVDSPAMAKALGRIKTIGADGDLVPGRDVFMCEIAGTEDQERAIECAREGYVVVRTKDWTVIPLENLVSRSSRVISAVKTAADAKMALGVLEQGTAGVFLESSDPAVIREVGAVVHHSLGTTPLVSFTVTTVTQLGLGDRVCVDTCTMMGEGEGMLIGNTSSAFLLVHAETLENPYVAPRPFRVNGGAVHAYILCPGGKTSYLSELKAGDGVLTIRADGSQDEAYVGRVKIERRPLLLVEAEGENGPVSLVLQNAETIRLVRDDRTAVSVVSLSPGDRVLGAVTEGGRHFGFAVRERIVER